MVSTPSIGPAVAKMNLNMTIDPRAASQSMNAGVRAKQELEPKPPNLPKNKIASAALN